MSASLRSCSTGSSPTGYGWGLSVRRVRGDSAAATRQVTVAAVNDAPVLSATGTGTAVAGQAYTLNLSATDADGVTITSWTISWGDGHIETLAGNPASATHTYAAAGTYAVTLTVIDDDGATGTLVKSATVTAPPPNQTPTASFTAATTDLTVTLDGAASTDADGTVTITGGLNDRGYWRLWEKGYCTQWFRMRHGAERCFTLDKTTDGKYRVYKPDGEISMTIIDYKSP